MVTGAATVESPAPECPAFAVEPPSPEVLSMGASGGPTASSSKVSAMSGAVSVYSHEAKPNKKIKHVYTDTYIYIHIIHMYMYMYIILRECFCAHT